MADSNRRSRSRSPSRRAPKGNRGFRWKDNRANDRSDDRRDQGRNREYRDRSPSHRRNYGRDSDRPRDDRQRDDRRRNDRPRSPRRERADKTDKDGAEKPRKEKKAPAVLPAGQELIVVNINDRLGTKSAIPCLPSDTVGQLKLMVAARIGREPGQIMLKRQGERPFKDMITLEDYGISNGVQLDLEVDTGD